MWELIGASIITSIICGLGYYYYKKRYNDIITELLTVNCNSNSNLNSNSKEIKCIKYQYRSKKYIYLTDKLDTNIEVIRKEIDVNNTDKDKIPETEYKYIILKIIEKNTNQVHEIIIDEPKLLFAFIGPANSYYFAFDKNFNTKFTIFMTYLFTTEEGALTYGRLSYLLNPEKYFKIKSTLTEFKKNGDCELEWCFN